MLALFVVISVNARAASASVPPPAAFVCPCVALVKLAMVGVTMVGDVPNTAKPDPVSSVMQAAKLALDGVARNVAQLLPSPEIPVLIGTPVRFVPTPLAGVPSAGATKVLFVNVCVLVVSTAVPSCDTICALVPSYKKATHWPTTISPVAKSVVIPPIIFLIVSAPLAFRLIDAAPVLAVFALNQYSVPVA